MPKRNFSTHTKKVCVERPWRAQIRTQNIEVYLGTFATWDEAKATEDAYRLRKQLPSYNPNLATKKSA